MLPRYLPPSFCSIQLRFWSRKQLKTFKMDTMVWKSYWRTYNWRTYHGQQTTAYINWSRAKASEELTIEDLQVGCCGGHHVYHNKMVLAILNLHVGPMPPIMFPLNPTSIQEQMRFENFQDGHLGGHLRYQNRIILAILNLYVAPMPPFKLWLNLHYGLGGDVIWRIPRWLTGQPSWISEWKEFSCSESTCLPNASHQV